MKNKIEDLRNHLFATIEALSDNDKPMEIDRAKAICDVAGKLVDLAYVEVEFIKEIGLGTSEFFNGKPIGLKRIK